VTAWLALALPMDLLMETVIGAVRDQVM